MSAVRSPTQLSLQLAEIAAVVSSGLDATVVDGSELTGGGFATVWLAALADGREVVVKVGPPDSARLLEYEKGLIPAEAEYFRLVRSQAPGVPVPQVLAASPDWVITTRLPGRALTESDSPAARRQLGAAIAQVHTITGTRFGYTGDRPAGADWPTAFAAMIDSLRADAARWQVPLPPLDGVVDRHRGALAVVTRPALLHFDLWDGNVLAGPDGSLSGLVDGERHLYGDPLLDLVSPALFRRIEDEPSHPFLAGYGNAALDRIRLSLYRVHLYLLMLAEGPSRGIAVTDGRHDFVTGLLTGELAALDEFPGPSR
jgi:aminoglycoside phosphotransferase (APT) family kinase protein